MRNKTFPPTFKHQKLIRAIFWVSQRQHLYTTPLRRKKNSRQVAAHTKMYIIISLFKIFVIILSEFIYRLILGVGFVFFRDSFFFLFFAVNLCIQCGPDLTFDVKIICRQSSVDTCIWILYLHGYVGRVCKLTDGYVRQEKEEGD